MRFYASRQQRIDQLAVELHPQLVYLEVTRGSSLKSTTSSACLPILSQKPLHLPNPASRSATCTVCADRIYVKSFGQPLNARQTNRCVQN